MNKSAPPRLLLIGPWPKPERGLTGGARVSFRALINYLQAQAYPFACLDIRPLESSWGLPINPLVVAWQTWRKRASYDVIWLNTSYRGLLFLAPILLLIARLAGKKIIFRPFGTDWYTRYVQARHWRRWLLDRVFWRADLLLLQTKALMAHFADKPVPCVQLPTSRPEPVDAPSSLPVHFSGRLVYLGHLKTSKGVDQLLEVARTLPPGYTLHLYGPVKEPKYSKLSPRYYRGVLRADEVYATLSQYDALLLPTFFPGEGYPGVIVEAYSLGLPVIATRWQAIPELVEDGITGFLIEPRSSEALRQGVERLAQANYQALSQAARRAFTDHYWEQRVVPRALAAIVQINR